MVVLLWKRIFISNTFHYWVTTLHLLKAILINHLKHFNFKPSSKEPNNDYKNSYHSSVEDTLEYIADDTHQLRCTILSRSPLHPNQQDTSIKTHHTTHAEKDARRSLHPEQSRNGHGVCTFQDEQQAKRRREHLSIWRERLCEPQRDAGQVARPQRRQHREQSTQFQTDTYKFQ